MAEDETVFSFGQPGAFAEWCPVDKTLRILPDFDGVTYLRSHQVVGLHAFLTPIVERIKGESNGGDTTETGPA